MHRPLLLSLAVLVLLVPTILGGACGVTVPPPPDDTGGGPIIPEVGVYVGAERCLQCHSNKHRTWSETLHSKALDSLAAIGQDTNAECLPCHTVGFGEKGGFVDAATTPGLAGVQCEHCHGGAIEHVQNVEDKTLRPIVTIDAAVCGKCHTDAHHPTFDEWSESPHRHVTEEIAEELEAGTNANSCGECHSGDARFAMKIQGLTIAADFLKGKLPEEQNAQTCAICHDPHERTGNAVNPPAGMDYQLRYPQVTHPEPTNDLTTITTNARYNICGQCHRDRGREWTATSRGSHHSIQSNVYIGEMPIKTGLAVLVPNTRSAHRFVPEQCSTCHMHAEAFVSEEVPANTGHHFEVNTGACSAIGCHPDEADAIAVTDALQAEVQAKLDSILARLGNISTWGYSSEGGPPAGSQGAIPDAIKKVRFLMNYASFDGSKGVHNPAYVRTMLTEAERLLASVGK